MIGAPFNTPGSSKISSFANRDVYEAQCHVEKVCATGLWKDQRALVATTAQGIYAHYSDYTSLVFSFLPSYLFLEALRISEVCPAAYYALASISPTHSEALTMYSTGAALGAKAATDWEAFLKDGSLWLSYSTRYGGVDGRLTFTQRFAFLCYIGKANTLLKMGR